MRKTGLILTSRSGASKLLPSERVSVMWLHWKGPPSTQIKWFFFHFIGLKKNPASLMYNLHTTEYTCCKCVLVMMFSKLFKSYNLRRSPVLEHFHHPQEPPLARLQSAPSPTDCSGHHCPDFCLCTFAFSATFTRVVHFNPFVSGVFHFP